MLVSITQSDLLIVVKYEQNVYVTPRLFLLHQ